MAAVLAAASGAAMAQGADNSAKPTIVLVHGAFADGSSWNGVIDILNEDGYRSIAAANPLRSVSGDAAAVSSIVKSIAGPVVLVGHSYGGVVITEAANTNPNVTALVYVAGFLPDNGESSLVLSAKYPGSTLGDALLPVELPGGLQDLYIRPEVFHAQFAADVPEAQARLMAATQRPVTLAALQEPSGVAAWKTLPSYVIYGSEDRNIPAELMAYLADRADAVRAVAIRGASHSIMISHPREVATLIEEAAAASAEVATLVQEAAATPAQ